MLFSFDILIISKLIDIATLLFDKNQITKFN